MDIEKTIETGLGSSGRLKLLRYLSRSSADGITKYAIEQSGLRYGDITANLRVLVEIGWVEGLPTQPRKYRINLDNGVVNALIEFFQKSGYL